MTEVQFWYDFASTYSYPAAMRIGDLATRCGVRIVWRPFLLGPIFADQGWRDSPFNLYPAKGHYMWRDMERICSRLQLPLQQPDPFPQNSLLAARVALTLAMNERPDFSRAVYRAEFGARRPIAEPATIAELLAGMGLAPGEILDRAASEPIKSRLRRDTEEARQLGIFGAPTLVAKDGELFWGNDRLEEGLDWAVRAGDAAETGKPQKG
jgi:2-hydroxychromene-2-carboxylate isomerase